MSTHAIGGCTFFFVSVPAVGMALAGVIGIDSKSTQPAVLNGAQAARWTIWSRGCGLVVFLEHL